MSKTGIFIRTSLGNAALDNPNGRLSGDEKRLMALIDGRTSLAEVGKKVPLSVRVQLEEIFARLSSARLIAETGKPGIDGPSETSEASQPVVPADQRSDEDSLALAELEREIEWRIELEQELVEVRAELSAMTARQKKIDASCDKLKQQVADYTKGMQAKLSEKMQTLSRQVNTEQELRASFECELRDSLDSLNQLNQALVEQQEHLERTLKLNALKPQSDDTQRQKTSVSETTRIARSNPHYRALRGLDFFKAFGNAELLHFLNLAKWQKVEAGVTVLRAGEVGIPFFIIVSGAVSVFKESNLLACLERGDSFGEFSHLSGDVPLRSAHVVAATACELLVVEPLDIEFSSVQMRLHVVEALLRGQVRKLLRSNQLVLGLSGQMDISAS